MNMGQLAAFQSVSCGIARLSRIRVGIDCAGAHGLDPPWIWLISTWLMCTPSRK